MERTQNSLLFDTGEAPDPTIDLIHLPVSPVLARTRTVQRVNHDALAGRVSTAGFENSEVLAFTKGQLPLIELITRILQTAGPADLDISTWSSEEEHIAKLLRMIQSRWVKNCRFLIDSTLNRRDPLIVKRMRELLGDESIRVGKTHSKFVVITNDKWQIVIRTTLNLENNPKYETFTVSHDPELATFIRGIVDEAWYPSGKLRRTPPLSVPTYGTKAEISEYTRIAEASDAVSQFTADQDLYGFTCGRYSLIHVIKCLLDKTGPAELSIATGKITGPADTGAWKSNRNGVTALLDLENVKSVRRWLLDDSFQRTDGPVYEFLLERCGPDSIRVLPNHAKVVLIQNDNWNVVVQTSMNLNHNPRFEDLAITNGASLASFFNRMLDRIWTTTPKWVTTDGRPKIQH